MAMRGLPELCDHMIIYIIIIIIVELIFKKFIEKFVTAEEGFGSYLWP